MIVFRCQIPARRDSCPIFFADTTRHHHLLYSVIKRYFDFSREAASHHNVFWGCLDAAATNGLYEESSWSIITFGTSTLRLISSEIPKANAPYF